MCKAGAAFDGCTVDYSKVCVIPTTVTFLKLFQLHLQLRCHILFGLNYWEFKSASRSSQALSYNMYYRTATWASRCSRSQDDRSWEGTRRGHMSPPNKMQATSDHPASCEPELLHSWFHWSEPAYRTVAKLAERMWASRARIQHIRCIDQITAPGHFRSSKI